jgi:integrase
MVAWWTSRSIRAAATMASPRISPRRRDRVASPVEAESLIAAVPATDRALWATAIYAGLRSGELQALRKPDVNLANAEITVEWSWDAKAGRVAPKSLNGRRVIPMAGALRDYLAVHLMDANPESDLVFPRKDGKPFSPSTIRSRAWRSWEKAGLQPITLHECRHTCASLMIAANINIKAISTYMGHSTVTITLDRYGHLMPGAGAEAAAMLDTYLRASAAIAAVS